MSTNTIPSDPEPILLQAAALYEQYPFRLFPVHGVCPDGLCGCGNPDCHKVGKHPCIKNWNKRATRDQTTLSRWAKDFPHANVGLVTGAPSGVIVLDIDPRNGGDQGLYELELQYGPLPPGPVVLTGGGGSHHYFRHPGGCVRSRPNLFPGVDVKGDGGYVLVPPSMHRARRHYCWDDTAHIDDFETLPDLPDALLQDLVNNEQAGKLGRTRLADLASATVVEGYRNETLTAVAGSLIGRGVDESLTFALLMPWNTTQCHPPLPAQEVETVVKSIARRESRRSQTASFPNPADAKQALLCVRNATSDTTPNVGAPARPCLLKLKWYTKRDLILNLDLPACSKALLITLWHHENSKTGEVWAAIPRMAKMAGISERTARAHLAGLVRAGLVCFLGRKRGSHGTNIYAIDWDEVCKQAAQAAQNPPRLPRRLAENCRVVLAGLSVLKPTN